MTRWTVPLLLLTALLVAACANGDNGEPPIDTPSPTDTPAPAALQIHHIDVDQADAGLIISPGGEVAMVDNGGGAGGNDCDSTLSYLAGLGVTSIDYLFASHYHADHIGCAKEMADAGITVTGACYDRGGETSQWRQFFEDYETFCGDRRQTALQGQVITLDAGAANPVTITVVDLDGAGVSMSSSEENGRSLVLLLTYGSFDEVLGGDLTGQSPDVETVVAPQVGDVEVYKVHHHGSETSSWDNWLIATTPEVGVISVGCHGTYRHPKSEALARLHSRSVHTYWTNVGCGVSPDPAWDLVGGDIVIEAEPELGGEFTVSGAGVTDTYVNQ